MVAVHRRAVLAGLGGAAALGRTAWAQRAESWPSRPIRLVLGFAPGGVGDITTRLIAPRISEVLGQPIVIDNRPGAAGMLAADAVLRSPPDGYTLLLLTTSNTYARRLYNAVTYDILQDFVPVGRLTTFDQGFFTGANSEYRTMQEVLAAAKERPGALNLGSISVGTGQYFGALLLRTLAGVDMTMVPYRSTPDLMNAATTGDVHLGCEILAPLLPQVRAGRLRLLAVGSSQRFPPLSDVPTAVEAGVPGYVAVSFNGVAAPAGTPPAIVERLGQAMVTAVNSPEIGSRLLDLGVRPDPLGPAEFASFVQGEVKSWGEVITAAGIQRQ
jgi:tripartite-type tricarboxylate transporter receptor subunit TctC